MSVVAIIPARGGSKAIPRKNLVDLAGRPLFHWTIGAAQSSGVVDRLIVSSDDPEILESAELAGAEAHHRPPALGADHVHAVHVVGDLLDALRGRGEYPDTVLMLLPTSPFRRAEHIAEAVKLLEREDPPSVISVTELDKQLIHLRTIDPVGNLEPFLPWHQLTAQRQEQPPLYALNGSVYAARPASLQAAGTFHVPGARAIVMDARSSVDINEPSDLEWARYLAAQEVPVS
ncbi:MAG: acylneuraminate cytidylyltransferase family protein [Actinomycetia bacterium]|nr:acylneuraminate cytidylyltransferase family protein [Actinomycetes bacterium]